VRSFPTILFLDENGAELDRILGVHAAGSFLAQAEAILARRSPLMQAAEQLEKQWNDQTAGQIALVYAQRNDLRHLRPLTWKVLERDPDLQQSTTLDAFFVLVQLEDAEERLSPETADLVGTFISRIGTTDPRRNLAWIAYTRELARRRDVAELRLRVKEAGKLFGETDPVLAEITSILGTSERKKGDVAAIATLRRAVALSSKPNPPSSLLPLHRVALAEALVALGPKPEAAAEARTLVAEALKQWSGEPGILSRAARVYLAAGAAKEALQSAQRAVNISQGEDADSQAALAACLLANGETEAARSAWRKAGELDPANAEYKKDLKTAVKKS
jgi:tetratricopeptide (TPR) repeat protein